MNITFISGSAELPASRRLPTAARRRQQPFTLIELLVVMGILAMILVMAVPAFEKLSIGAGVDGAARAINGQLQLTRQYAIANRQRVALVMPANSFGESDKRYVAMRAAVYDKDSGYYIWAPNAAWEFIPTGAIIAQADTTANTLMTTGSPPPADMPAMTVDIDEDNDGTADLTSVRAVIFRSGGALENAATVYVTVIEGAYTGSGIIVRNTSNQLDIAINPFTGRIKVE